MNGIEQQAMPIQAVSFSHVQDIHSVIRNIVYLQAVEIMPR